MGVFKQNLVHQRSADRVGQRLLAGAVEVVLRWVVDAPDVPAAHRDEGCLKGALDLDLEVVLVKGPEA